MAVTAYARAGPLGGDCVRSRRRPRHGLPPPASSSGHAQEAAPVRLARSCASRPCQEAPGGARIRHSRAPAVRLPQAAPPVSSTDRRRSAPRLGSSPTEPPPPRLGPTPTEPPAPRPTGRRPAEPARRSSRLHRARRSRPRRTRDGARPPEMETPRRAEGPDERSRKGPRQSEMQQGQRRCSQRPAEMAPTRMKRPNALSGVWRGFRRFDSLSPRNVSVLLLLVSYKRLTWHLI